MAFASEHVRRLVAHRLCGICCVQPCGEHPEPVQHETPTGKVGVSQRA